MSARKNSRKSLTKEQRQELAEKRRTAVVALRDRLNQWEENTDPEIIAMIIARFSDYSARNAMLIAMQCPEATEIHGFQEWLGQGRIVTKGEHGIQILAPAGTYRETDEGLQSVKDGETAEAGETRRQFFRIAHVFDRSQTHPVDESATAEPQEEVLV